MIVILYQTSSSQTLFPIIEHHASLQCIRPHPVRKQISVRAIRRIKDDAIVKDLDKFIKGVLMLIQWLKCMIGFYLNCWTNMLHYKDNGCG